MWQLNKYQLAQSLYVINKHIKNKLTCNRKNHSKWSVERLYKVKDETLTKMEKEGLCALLGYQTAYYKYHDNKRYYLYQIDDRYLYHVPVEYGDDLSEVTYLGLIMDEYQLPYREPVKISFKQALLNLDRYKKGKVTLFG